MSPKKDVERKRGNRLGFWFFRTAVRLFGLRGAYGLLYFVSLYYLAFDRAAVAASKAYVRRRFPDHGIIRQQFDVYLLFVSQGKSLIDRYCSGRRRQMRSVSSSSDTKRSKRSWLTDRRG